MSSTTKKILKSNKVLRNHLLTPFLYFLGQGGVISDSTTGSLQKYVLDGMFDYVSRVWGYNRSFFESREPPLVNCNGAFSAWSAGGPKAVAALEKWRACALDQSCICPRNSNKGNHRQDQSALTLVLAMMGLSCTGHKWVAAHGIKKHLTPAEVFEKHASKCRATLLAR